MEGRQADLGHMEGELHSRLSSSVTRAHLFPIRLSVACRAPVPVQFAAVEFEALERDRDAFWVKYSTPDGQKMNFLAISESLKRQRKRTVADEELDANEALAFFNATSRSVVGASPRGRFCTSTAAPSTPIRARTRSRRSSRVSRLASRVSRLASRVSRPHPTCPSLLPYHIVQGPRRRRRHWHPGLFPSCPSSCPPPA